MVLERLAHDPHEVGQIERLADEGQRTKFEGLTG